jgi:hypothetical protein
MPAEARFAVMPLERVVEALPALDSQKKSARCRERQHYNRNLSKTAHRLATDDHNEHKTYEPPVQLPVLFPADLFII